MAKLSQGNKTRVLLVLIAVIVIIIGIAVVIWALKKRSEKLEHVQASVQGVPSILSLPGVGTSTKQHAQLIQQENIAKAKKAEAERASFVPTITRRGYVGQAVNVPPMGMQIQGPTATGCDPAELDRARRAGVKVDELRCKGCTSEQLHAAGFTAGELMAAGLSATDLRAGGYTAAELRQAGFDATELAQAGYAASELKQAGFNVTQLKATKAFDAKILKEVGYKPSELKEAGFSAAQLRAAGDSAADLKAGGYAAAEARKADFVALELIKAGYSPQELVEAGFTDSELSAANISPQNIKAARSAAGPLDKLPKDCNAKALADARSKGFTAQAIRQKLNCPPSALMEAGFSAEDLRVAQYTPKELKTAGFSPAELKAGSFDLMQIKAAGFTLGELKSAGFTVGELARAGFTASELAKAGFKADDLRAAGLTANDLKAAGLSLADLKAAGYSTGELIRAGFAPEGVAAPPGISPITAVPALPAGAPVAPPSAATRVNELIQAGYTPSELEKAGFLTPPATLPSQPAVTTPTSAPTSAAPSAVTSAAKEAAQRVSAISGTAPAAIAKVTTPSASAISAAVTPPLPTQEADAEKLLEKLQENQSKGMNPQQRGDLQNKIISSMTAQANQLIASWNPPPTQVFVPGQAGVIGGIPQGSAIVEQAGGSTAVAGGAAPAGALPGTGAAGAITAIKAGDIMFGVLDTGINSDEQSPILATIVQGSLKGGRLLGQFSRAGEKVVLTFTTMSLPGLPRSISVNAVAIDPDTARTAIASEVDNHYLLRYGTLFASSFVSGLAQAVAQSGSTIVTEPFGQAIIQNPTTSALEKGLIALGNVGTQYAGVLKQNFNRAPTITVDSGAGIGILFMADLSLPNPPPAAGVAAGGEIAVVPVPAVPAG